MSLEMKRFILFPLPLLFYYHAVLAQPCLTFLFSSALLQLLRLHLLTLEKQLLSYAKKKKATPISLQLCAESPLLHLLVVMITTNSLWQFLFNYCVLIEILRGLSIHMDP